MQIAFLKALFEVVYLVLISLLQDAPGSSRVLLSLVLELFILLECDPSFYWKMLLETSVWAVYVLIAENIACHCFYGLSGDRARK